MKSKPPLTELQIAISALIWGARIERKLDASWLAEEITELPELAEMREKADALDILEYGYPQEVQKALEKVREMSLRDEIDALLYELVKYPEQRIDKTVDAILNLPKMKDLISKAAWTPLVYEWKEKSELWDESKDIIEGMDKASAFIFSNIPTPGSDDELLYVKKMKQLDLLMDRMMVREKCIQDLSNAKGEIYHASECVCHGTGTITRPAEVQEVRELLERIFIEGHWIGEFKLKSGHTLYMKEKDESGKAS